MVKPKAGLRKKSKDKVIVLVIFIGILTSIYGFDMLSRFEFTKRESADLIYPINSINNDNGEDPVNIAPQNFIRSAGPSPIVLNFNTRIDKVFGFEPGAYTFNCSLFMKKGYNILFYCRAYYPIFLYNLSLEIWDPIGRYYHILNRTFDSEIIDDSAWGTDYGTSIEGNYLILAKFEIGHNISLHVRIEDLDAIINEFYPAGRLGDTFYDYRVFNESIKIHEFYIPVDSDTEYTFNFVRVTPISEYIKDTYYPGESYPVVNGHINMDGIRFYLWNNISTIGYKKENAAFKTTLGSFSNGTVKFTVEMEGIYTNMVFLFQSYSTQRIGDGPDAVPGNKTGANQTIEDFFDTTQEKVVNFMFNDTVILTGMVILLLAGLFMFLKSQSAVYIIQ